MSEDPIIFNSWKWKKDEAVTAAQAWRYHPKANVHYLAVSADGAHWEVFLVTGRLAKQVSPVTGDDKKNITGSFSEVTSACEKHFYYLK